MGICSSCDTYDTCDAKPSKCCCDSSCCDSCLSQSPQTSPQSYFNNTQYARPPPFNPNFR